jgi:hypothetical protein
MPEKLPFPYQAAKASWMAPLLAIALGFAGTTMLQNNQNLGEQGAGAIRSGKIVIGLIAIAIVVVGIVFGILALFGIKKHGPKGILIPSIAGLLLSSGYLYLVVSTLLIAKHMAEQRAIVPH